MDPSSLPIVRIQGRVQNYDWGRNEACIVSELCGDSAIRPPYAEIWYGTHSRLPSFQYGTKQPIDVKLPFLLKFLSIENPLSLQIHPDAETAERLFNEDKVHYVDPNAKPEICIPLSRFHCFLGFMDQDLLEQQMDNNPPLRTALQYKHGDEARELLVRAHLLDTAVIEGYIAAMEDHIHHLTDAGVPLSNHQALFARLYKKYGIDVGLVACFLLRYEIFEPYHAFFIVCC